MSTPRFCLVDGCRQSVEEQAPIDLCPWHFAVAAEWATRSDGVTDVLPTPCALCGSRIGVRWPSAWVCAVCEWRHGEPLDAELPPPRVDVVYYLRYGDRIKIGTTAQPRRRFAAIWHDEVLAFEPGDRSLEQRRHAQFAAHRLEGSEWFRSAPDLRAHVDGLRSDGRDPWEMFARWTSEAWARRG